MRYKFHCPGSCADDAPYCACAFAERAQHDALVDALGILERLRERSPYRQTQRDRSHGWEEALKRAQLEIQIKLDLLGDP